jgi:rhodanese-related sulfurtransferase
MDVPEVNCTEAVAMREAGATWIDVREHDEWTEAHIGDTVHLPLGEAFEGIASRFPDTSAKLVVSCLSGGRSGRVVSRLRSLGYTDVHNLRGGITAWVGEGRPVVTGD